MCLDFTFFLPSVSFVRSCPFCPSIFPFLNSACFLFSLIEFLSHTNSTRLTHTQTIYTSRIPHITIKMAEAQIEPQSPPQTVRIPQRQSGTPKIHDLVCIGFGTLGLGLAVALQDTDYSQSSTLFLEQNASFVPDLASSATHLTTSFAQDLATLRNPTSKYTYLNYLCEKGDLGAVVGENGSPFPERDVFAGYLSWAAAQLNGLVAYGKCVTDVRAVEVGGLGSGMQLWAVTMRDIASGRKEVLAARNVVFAQGREAVFAQEARKTEGGLQSAVEAAKDMCAEVSFFV